MSLQRLRWLTVVVTVGFLVVVQGVAMGFVMPTFGRPYGHAVSISGFTAGIIVITALLYGTIDRMQARIVRQREESEALYEIAVDIAALDDKHDVLRSIVDRAREMLGAEAAALCLLSPNGAPVVAAHAGLPEVFRVPGVAANGTHAAPEDPVRGDCPLTGHGLDTISTDLVGGGKKIGELCVSPAPGRPASDDDVRLLKAMADLAAIEVQKGKLLERDRLVAVLEERERLAREMHDSLAQVLGYLHLKSQSAERALGAGDDAKVRAELAEITSVSQEAYADVREAILGLRETVSQRRGFVDALREYAAKFSQQAGVSTQVEVRCTETVNLPPEAEVQLMRVIQEALTNVRKHSGARTACVCLEQQGGLRITVEDDGNGFDPDRLDGKQDHYGLFTMRERVERVGGRLEIDSARGRGTRVRVIFSSAETP